MIEQQVAIDIDFDWAGPPESQLMRRAKAHFDRLGIAYRERAGVFYFGRVRFCLSTRRVWIQGHKAFARRRGFLFLHAILRAEGRGRHRPGKGEKSRRPS
jgi:hypothetical protein